MLRFLSIRHLAVIDQIELEFGPGLTVLTGETGAGKSILMGAVGLLVGGRASAELVRTGEESASIEAVFDTPDGREVIVRREVSAQGRSRAFVDGALVTSGALRDALGPARRPARPARTSGPARSRDRTSRCSTRTRASREERANVAEAFSAWQKIRAERDRLIASQRESAVARRVRRVPARRDRSRGAEGRRRRRARRDAPGARQRRQAAAALCRRLPDAVRRRPGRARVSRRRLAQGRGALRQSTNASRRTSPPATR